MKSICITGASQTDALLVCDILQQAGMKSPRSVKRDDSIDLAFWHEQVLAIAMEESSETQPIAGPGRLWEQLASDIFVANIKSDVWGWADTRSTWLLDFWLDFDPRLNFILVCESPQQTLAGAISRGSSTVSVGSVMATWQLHHQELLRFHHRNPERSLLVDIRDCAGHPRDLIERCTTKWNISLPLTVAAASPHHEADSLALYLAHQLCKDYPDTITLQNEVAATLARLGETGSIADSGQAEPTRTISAYQSLRDEAAKLPRVQAALDNLNASFNENSANHTRTAAELQHVKAALDALNSRFEDTVVSHTRLQQDHEDRIKEAAQENELLLVQLLQLQEELEITLLESKARTERLNSAEAKFEESERECELLRAQLRQVQDELEHSFQQRQDAVKQLTAMEERWQRLLKRIPDYRDNNLVEFVAIDSRSGNGSAPRLGSHNGSGHAQTKLAIKTVSVQRSTGPIARWPANAANHLLQSLTRLLKKTGEPPSLLHYDRVNLKREQVNPDYEHLWLRFENLELEEKHWPEFEFRLSCANVRPKHFGHYPKLEFPEDSSQAPFESWFVEAYDDFGAKLELRFAIPESGEPESMDLAVWQRVSGNDRAFLSSLVASLPTILEDLKSTGVHLKRSWEDWGQMALEIQRVVALRAGQPPARSRSMPAKPVLVSKSHKA